MTLWYYCMIVTTLLYISEPIEYTKQMAGATRDSDPLEPLASEEALLECSCSSSGDWFSAVFVELAWGAFAGTSAHQRL